MDQKVILMILAVVAVLAYFQLNSSNPVSPTTYKAPGNSSSSPSSPSTPSTPSTPAVVANVNWKGYAYTKDGRCGPSNNNTACGGTQCCSVFGWCGGQKGQNDDWCKTLNANNGEFDSLKP